LKKNTERYEKLIQGTDVDVRASGKNWRQEEINSYLDLGETDYFDFLINLLF